MPSMMVEQAQRSIITITRVMNYFYSRIQSILHHGPQQLHTELEYSVSDLNARDRESLVLDVARELDRAQEEEEGAESFSSLAGLEGILDRCRTSLESFERKERFVGMRMGNYRRLIERREERVCELLESDDGSSRSDEDDRSPPRVDDVEDGNPPNSRERLDALRERHAVDRERLRGVEDVHKNFLVQIEVLRRRINDLEEKQEGIVARREECRDFLITAAEFT